MSQRTMNLFLATMLIAMTAVAFISRWEKSQAQQRLAELADRTQEQWVRLEKLEQQKQELEESLDQKVIQIQSLKEQLKDLQQQ